MNGIIGTICGVVGYLLDRVRVLSVLIWTGLKEV